MRALRRFWPDLRPQLRIYVVVLLLTLVANVTTLVIPLLAGYVIDGPIAARNLSGLWWPILAVLAVGIVEAAALWGRRLLIAPVASGLEVHWRAKLFDHLQHISISRHDAWDSGQLLSRATADLSQLRRFVAFGAPFLLTTPLLIIIGGIILAALHPVLALILAIAAVPTVAATVVFEAKYRVASRLSQDQTGELTTVVEESVQGIRILKAFGRTPWAYGRFTAMAAAVRGTELRKVRLDSLMWPLLTGLPALAMGAMLTFGVFGILGGWMSVGTLVAGVSVMMFIRVPVEMLGFLLADAFMSATAAARYWEVMDTPVDIADPARPQHIENARGRLEFNDVTFEFDDASAPLLRNVDLSIEPGQTLALVGSTGSGKSALVSLVPRLYDVTDGSVTLDGVDVRSLPLAELRRHVAVAFEEPVLFSDTVAVNVAMGAPEATVDQIWDALETAQAAEFVRELPAGLETKIGEQGLSLSGGQRQRLALARAVLGQPAVVVLDDPLSAVDVDTEDRVQARLATRLADSTILIVAHRPSTAALADAVAVLAGGRIVAVGTHESLLAGNEHYRELMGAAAARRP